LSPPAATKFDYQEDVMIMTPARLFITVPAALLVLGPHVALAGTTIEEAGVLVCASDKWDEKEQAKGHKLVDYAGRCVKVPDDPAAAKTTEECVGKYEYMPDGNWKGSGACALTIKGGDTISITWEEGSHLKENLYKATAGSGKFKGVGGGGTYQYDQLTDTLFGGRYNSKWELP
jgi:hypothetical protein